MNPYATPGDPPTPGDGRGTGGRGTDHAWFDGDVLVVARGTRFPLVCIKCASHQDIVYRPAKFQWTPTWARMSVIFCVIGGLIAMAVTTKRAELQVPLCPACNTCWTAARNALIGAVIALVLSPLSLLALRLGDDPLAFLVIVGVVIVGFVVALAYVKPRVLQVQKIDDQFVELKNCHPSAAREVVEGSSQSAEDVDVFCMNISG